MIKTKFFMIFLLIMALIIFTGCIMNSELDEVEDINFSQVASGTYTGDHKYPKTWNDSLSYAKVTVIVEQPRVVKITLDEFEYGLGKKAETLIDIVMDKQTLNVDAISGATASSNCILNAIEKALKQGLNQ